MRIRPMTFLFALATLNFLLVVATGILVSKEYPRRKGERIAAWRILLAVLPFRSITLTVAVLNYVLRLNGAQVGCGGASPSGEEELLNPAPSRTTPISVGSRRTGRSRVGGVSVDGDTVAASEIQAWSAIVAGIVTGFTTSVIVAYPPPAGPDPRRLQTPDGRLTQVRYGGPTRYYYVTDHLGSVVGAFDATGVWQGGHSYSPYGEQRASGTTNALTSTSARYIGGVLRHSLRLLQTRRPLLRPHPRKIHPTRPHRSGGKPLHLRRMQPQQQQRPHRPELLQSYIRSRICGSWYHRERGGNRIQRGSRNSQCGRGHRHRHCQRAGLLRVCLRSGLRRRVGGL
jgi:hypothetical protein